MPVDFCGSLFETNRHASYMLVVGAHLYVSSFFLFLLLLSPRVIHKCPPVCQFASFCAPLPSLFFFFNFLQVLFKLLPSQRFVHRQHGRWQCVSLRVLEQLWVQFCTPWQAHHSVSD